MEVDLSVQADTSNLMELDQRIMVYTGNSIESDQSVDVVAEVGMRTKIIFPVPESMPTSELIGVVEDVAEVVVPSAAKQGKFLGAGQLYEEGKYGGKIPDDDFVDVGGFSIQKKHASLYEAIWLKYGHIASNQVLTDFYESQVMVVTEVMDVIVGMNDHPLEKISSKMIDEWEKNIRVAEKLEFNIFWLRQRFEDIKKYFAEGEKLQETLKERDKATAEVTEAEQQLALAKQKLSALQTKITPIVIGRKRFHEECGAGLLLISCGTNLSVVTAPVQKDGIVVEEPTDNNSKTVRSKRPAKKIRLIKENGIWAAV